MSDLIVNPEDRFSHDEAHFMQENADLSQTKVKDFLAILLTAKDDNGVGMTPLEIRNEVDTFLFEGSIILLKTNLFLWLLTFMFLTSLTFLWRLIFVQNWTMTEQYTVCICRHFRDDLFPKMLK